MSMMERFLESNTSCECDDCKRSTQRFKKVSASLPRRNYDKENGSPARNSDRYLCSEHRGTPISKRPPPRDKFATNTTTPMNRADKVNILLKADTVQDVLEVFKSTPTTAEENQLANNLQKVVAAMKTYSESKAKIIEYCQAADIEPEAVYGLVAKFRQERSILTSALITSNTERERALVDYDKCLQAIHEVNDLMYMLRDVAKEGKEATSDDMRHSLQSMIVKIHELAKNPSALYDELMDLREEYDEQIDRFRDVEGCHEKLHEDKRKLQDDLSAEKKEHLETRRKLSALQSTKNEVNQAHKTLDKVHAENTELRKEIDKINAELNKVNALKHENTQLKKKLATAEAAKVEQPVADHSIESASSAKKKKSKKGTVNQPQEGSETATTTIVYKIDPVQEKEIKSVKSINADLQSQISTLQTQLRQLEPMLKKAEAAKTKALEKQQVEQATAENWKDLSEGHQEESNRLRIQLDQSMTHASALQNNLHQLEQGLAEAREQLQAQTIKRSTSPSIQSSTSTTSRADAETNRMLRKLRAEIAQLFQDLDTARSYPGDPWNLIDCTRNMLAAMEQDLEQVSHKEQDNPNPIPETYMPQYRQDVHVRTPISLPRVREATPPLTGLRGQVNSQRPLLPPGLVEPSVGRSSPKPQLPSPIGTGRPTKLNEMASPIHAPAIPSRASVQGGLGNGTVDWSVWSSR